jgi:hypothetical protein
MKSIIMLSIVCIHLHSIISAHDNVWKGEKEFMYLSIVANYAVLYMYLCLEFFTYVEKICTGEE